MYHFARRTAGYSAVLAAAALLLAAGCSSDDNSNNDSNSSASAMSSSMAMDHGGSNATGAMEETKIATPGGEEVTVSGVILEKYNKAGGLTGPLGAPLEAEETGPNDGKYQDFTGGTIYWAKDGGDPYIVWGEIRKTWEDNGGANGKLGYPTSDEKDITGGKESEFTGGKITWVDNQTTVTPTS